MVNFLVMKKPLQKIKVIERKKICGKHCRTLVIKRVKKYYEVDEEHPQNSVILGMNGKIPSHLVMKTFTYWEW